MDQKQENKLPFRILIEHNGAVLLDKPVNTIFGVLNDGERGATFLHFKRSEVKSVMCALVSLRTIEAKMLKEYPEGLRKIMLAIIDAASIEPADESTKTEETDEADEIPCFKLEDR